AVAGLAVTVLNAVGERLLLFRVEQRRLVDFTEVRFQGGLDRIAPYAARSCHGEVPSRVGVPSRLVVAYVRFRRKPKRGGGVGRFARSRRKAGQNNSAPD